MRKTVSTFILFFFATLLRSQPVPDSTLLKYHSAKTNDEKSKCLSDYFTNLKSTNTTGFNEALAISTFFKKQNDELGADYADVYLSYFLVQKGDFTAALNLCFPVLEKFEKRHDIKGMISANRAITNAYFLAKEYDQAAAYSKKVLTLIPDSDAESISKLYNGIGCIYGEAGMADSGMVYAQKAVNMDTEMKNYQRLALSISTLAENYIAAKEYDIALAFLRKSLDYYTTGKAKVNKYLYAYLMNDFAQVFLQKQLYDSSIYYSAQAIDYAVPSNYQDQSMRAYEYLYKSYESKSNRDSVNKYFRLAMTTKDSLFNLEKMKSIQALSFREEMRQLERETEKVLAEKERNQNIQYAVIALGIICFIILFFLLSHSVIVTEKWISFFGILGLLIVFEFINLLIHPFLENATHHSPLLMLLALVVLASLLIPLHHRLEKLIKEKMIKKNKKIRLENAKKTIEKLEEIE
ncbi:MAG TPA: hypothetical protein PKK99_06540 [Bacteroidia bacterium]|nr:hypothetical protein [Bacteroidia bacterium]